jgi:hypothetical protein
MGDEATRSMIVKDVRLQFINVVSLFHLKKKEKWLIFVHILVAFHVFAHLKIAV